MLFRSFLRLFLNLFREAYCADSHHGPFAMVCTALSAFLPYQIFLQNHKAIPRCSSIRVFAFPACILCPQRRLTATAHRIPRFLLQSPHPAAHALFRSNDFLLHKRDARFHASCKNLPAVPAPSTDPLCRKRRSGTNPFLCRFLLRSDI